MQAKSLSEAEWTLRDRLLAFISPDGKPMLKCREIVDRDVEGVKAYLGMV